MASNFKTWKTSKTSFQRKLPRKVLKLAGTKASIHNSQLLLSTGVPSLDALIGGGLPLGTVILIEEDAYANYANVLFKYFLAEGVVSEQKLFVSSLTSDPVHLLKTLPKPVCTEGGGTKSEKAGNLNPDSLKIAFQYKNLPAVQSRVDASPFNHYYDLSETMDQDLVKKSQPRSFTPEECEGKSSLYDQLLRAIHTRIVDGNFTTGAPLKEDATVLRIALQALHSPLWVRGGGGGGGGQAADSKSETVEFCRFLSQLRAIVRYSLATCLVTVPAHLQQNGAMVQRIERMCDIVLRLESFAGSERETNPIFKDYQGLFHIVKLPSLNSLTCHRQIVTDFGFKLRRRKFLIETLHLPPELPETTNRSQDDDEPAVAGRCFTAGPNKLDF